MVARVLFSDDLPVLDDVVDVPLHDAVGLQGLVDVVGQGGVLNIRQVFQVEGALGPLDAPGGEGGGTGLLVHHVVRVQILALLLLLVHGGVDHLLQAGDKVVGLAVEIGALVALTGDDQRGAGLVDEDGVHLVHDGEDVAPLDHVRLVEGHVVPQVVEAHLIVGAVGDVAGVGLPALQRGESVDDQAHADAQEAVHLAHPLAVAAGQVVVDGDDVHAPAGEGVEIGGQHGHQGLAFAGLHLGDAALVQHDAADELHPEGLHAQHAPGGLPGHGESLRQNVVQGLSLRQALFELVGHLPELGVFHGGKLRLQRLDFVGDGVYSLQFPVGIGSEQLGKQSHIVFLPV